jgi:hypothetical protein
MQLPDRTEPMEVDARVPVQPSSDEELKAGEAGDEKVSMDVLAWWLCSSRARTIAQYPFEYTRISKQVSGYSRSRRLSFRQSVLPGQRHSTVESAGALDRWKHSRVDGLLW